MAFKKTGDWEKVERMVKAIKPEMVAAKNKSLRNWGLKAEGLAKKHISMQDLNWKPLKAETIAAKIRKGLSEDVLVATSSYFQSITSWADIANNTVYAGVKKEARNKDGVVIANIAAIHEYGSLSGNIPKRELWHPTFQEVMTWHFKYNTPERLFAERMKKYY